MASSSALLFILIIIAVCACQSQLASCRRHGVAVSLMAKRHKQWMATHGKVYKNAKERVRRFKVFRHNVKFIETFNANNNNNNNTSSSSFKVSLNEFADLTNQEFKALFTGYMRPSQLNINSVNNETSSLFNPENYNSFSLPDSVDWRQKGAVTPVKQQGRCGSCWAFSAVAAIEGITQIKSGRLLSLSTQELIDCIPYPYARGCSGGKVDGAFFFIARNGGIVTSEAAYPYKGYNNACLVVNPSNLQYSKIIGYQNVRSNCESALMMAVAQQPVVVGIGVTGPGFQFYSGGVYTGDGCGTYLNHGVTVVGYGTDEDGTKYWLVKNSYGTYWGEQGYMRMKRDVADPLGLCGIAMAPIFPLV